MLCVDGREAIELVGDGLEHPGQLIWSDDGAGDHLVHVRHVLLEATLELGEHLKWRSN